MNNLQNKSTQPENPRLMQKLTDATTCNEVAAILFPDAAKTGQAFLEFENPNMTEVPYLELLDLNDDFWALALEHTVFVSAENQFRQYQEKTGLYALVQESTLIGQLITKLNTASKYFPKRLKFGSFLHLRDRGRLKVVIQRAKDVLGTENTIKDQCLGHLSLDNGIFDLNDNTFKPHSPPQPITEKLPVKYDPAARPEMFLGAFLNHILEPDDIDLLQRYASQFLQGINYSQKILILTGDAGWGKSSLMKIFGSLLGWDRIGIIRDKLYRDDSELAHYQHKHLLYAPDMPTQFLNDPKCSLIKQLVGGDPLWAETKDSGRIILEGNFPLILACNGKPQIKLDQDSDAWLRRLVVLNFKKPTHEKHLGKLAELLARESSGILNWMLDGRKKLVKDRLQLTLTKQQQERANVLLLASESPAAFVRSALVKRSDGQVGSVELFEHYQEWCKRHQVPPFSSKEFNQIAKIEIETCLGLRYRHDLDGAGGCVRGWKGLALVEA
jgi:P4 family phage/plasmid primase-like protien